MDTQWNDGLRMFGVEIGVAPRRAKDMNFIAQTDMVVVIANKLLHILVGATLADNKEDIKQALDSFEVLKRDFERGASNGVFNPKDVEKMVKVVNEFIADPLAILKEDEATVLM